MVNIRKIMLKKTQKNKLFLLIRIAVVVTGLALAGLWLSKDNNFNDLVKLFGRLNIAVFALSLSIFITGQFVVALRWWILLGTQSIHISFAAAVKLHFLGLFYNNFMPGAVGGDLIRAWYVTNHTEHKFAAALSVFVDRVIGLLSTLVIAVVFYFTIMAGKEIKSESAQNNQSETSVANFFIDHKTIFLCIAAVVIITVLVLLLTKQGRALLSRTVSAVISTITSIFQKTLKAFLLYSKRPDALILVFLLTVALQMATITGYWLVGKNLGIDAPLKYYYLFFTLTWVLGAVPVSIAGAVVVEGSLVVLFTRYTNTPKDAALAIALVQRFVWMLASLPGSAIHLLGMHLPKNFDMDFNKEND